MNADSNVILILASTSPRRAKLLRDAAVAFEQRTPFDDSHVMLGDVSPVRAVEALAYLKATSVADTLERGLVIGCDTMLAVGDKAIGKPRDREDAAAILNELFTHPHQAINAVALVDARSGRNELFHDAAEVTIARPPEEQVARYLESGQWQGKAGGYNLAQLESRWQFAVTGDPTTVVGLPMRKLLPAIESFARAPEPIR